MVLRTVSSMKDSMLKELIVCSCDLLSLKELDREKVDTVITRFRWSCFDQVMF